MDYVLLVLIPPGHEALTHTTSEAKNSIKRSKCWKVKAVGQCPVLLHPPHSHLAPGPPEFKPLAAVVCTPG